MDGPASSSHRSSSSSSSSRQSFGSDSKSRSFAIAIALILLLLLLLLQACCGAEPAVALPPPSLPVHVGLSAQKTAHRNLNISSLVRCHQVNPYLRVRVHPDGPLPDLLNATVTISGVMTPLVTDWIGVISPSTINYHAYCPGVKHLYWQTGDLSKLPLLCHYPLKFQWMHKDPEYLSCTKRQCQIYSGSTCLLSTCNGSLTVRLVNIRTDIMFVFFGGGFEYPCILAKSRVLKFANPKSPLYGHLSSINSLSNSMKLTWISGEKASQYVQYADRKLVSSTFTTFQPKDLCGLANGPAFDFGWHDPGYIHSAVLSGVSPSQCYDYRYGSNTAGWSAVSRFCTPPSGGLKNLTFVVYGDMGKAERDGFGEHYLQPGSLGVVDALKKEILHTTVDTVLHVGDISYATGFLAEWDLFLEMISPIAKHISYMTAAGNHERDYPFSGSVYKGPDSGGECGVPYETYFQMPVKGKDKPWYSLELGPVHFTVISTEHPWEHGTEQHKWIQMDLQSVNRSHTPWLIFAGHRPMYSSTDAGILIGTLLPTVDTRFPLAIEPLLAKYQVDLTLSGHAHNYERTCAIDQSECKLLPRRNRNGVDLYKSTVYKAAIHVVAGTAGFKLEGFTKNPHNWSLVRISEFGYGKVQATRKQLFFQFKLLNGTIADQFLILKKS